MFAFGSVMANKLRTFLSLLGITIGIFCIISVFTVLDWMQKSVHDEISSLGENVIYVHKFPWGLKMIMLPFSISRQDHHQYAFQSVRLYRSSIRRT
jgi:ABC-type antimicrobial peptide transport system permease subunit